MPKAVHIRVEQDFAHPLADTYAWLTDIDDGDAARAGDVLKTRKVLERSEKRIVYEGETETLGTRIFARTEVDLAPPDRWHARTVAGPRTGSWTDYQITALPGGGTRARIDYHFVLVDPKKHRLLSLARLLVRRSLRRMWVGFSRSMDEELRAAQRRPTSGNP